MNNTPTPTQMFILCLLLLLLGWGGGFGWVQTAAIPAKILYVVCFFTEVLLVLHMQSKVPNVTVIGVPHLFVVQLTLYDTTVIVCGFVLHRVLNAVDVQCTYTASKNGCAGLSCCLTRSIEKASFLFSERVGFR